MTDEVKPIDPKDLAVIFSYTVQVGQLGQMHLQTTMLQGASQVEMDAIADKYAATARRLAAHETYHAAVAELAKTDAAEEENILQIALLNERNAHKQQWLTEDKNALSAAQQQVVMANKLRPKQTANVNRLKAELFGE